MKIKSKIVSASVVGFIGAAIATSAGAHDATSIFVKLFVGPKAVVDNASDRNLNRAWGNGTLQPARGPIYFQLKDAAGQVIDQGKTTISTQGRIKQLSAAEVKRASSIYIGTDTSGNIWQLADGRPASDGTAVLNFVVLDGQRGYQRLPR